jgi:PAS domain-containing protein
LFVTGFGLSLLALGITLAWFLSSGTAKSIESLSRKTEELGLEKGAGAITTAATDFPTRIAEVESVREALLAASRLIQERSAERDQVEQALTLQAETLRESEARFSGVINSAMDAVIAVDTAQRIVLFNLAAEQMFDCVAAEALGSSLDRFIPPRFR